MRVSRGNVLGVTIGIGSLCVLYMMMNDTIVSMANLQGRENSLDHNSYEAIPNRNELKYAKMDQEPKKVMEQRNDEPAIDSSKSVQTIQISTERPLSTTVLSINLKTATTRSTSMNPVSLTQEVKQPPESPISTTVLSINLKTATTRPTSMNPVSLTQEVKQPPESENPETTSKKPVSIRIIHPTENPKLKEKVTRPRKRYCVPHADLEKQHGLPGPCNDSLLVLDCPDPYMEYLRDPQVLTKCRVKNGSQGAEQREQIIKGPGSKDCGNGDGVLVSNSSLPVSPKPGFTPGKIPSIVHYVSLSCNRTFTFANYLSVLSVHRYIDPGRIYFHGDCTPRGSWWQRTVDEIPNIYFRERLRTKLIQGKPPRWVEHETDIIRLQVLLGKTKYITSPYKSSMGKSMDKSIEKLVCSLSDYFVT